ncbi:MAG: hypothetical protein LBE86_00540 [Gemmobacter sp.]|jgi:hypothetical protein|nr:hypothetical protein [Gemmobacter sp.]
MTELVIRAAYATVTTEDDLRYVGFVDARDEAYALFRQALPGGPVWFEVNDPDFGAEDAIETARLTPDTLTLLLRPAITGRFGYASIISIRLKTCEAAETALAGLRAMGLPGL